MSLSKKILKEVGEENGDCVIYEYPHLQVDDVKEAVKELRKLLEGEFHDQPNNAIDEIFGEKLI